MRRLDADADESRCLECRRFELCFPRRLGMRGVAGDLRLAVPVEPTRPSLLARSGLRLDRPRPGEQAPPSCLRRRSGGEVLSRP